MQDGALVDVCPGLEATGEFPVGFGQAVGQVAYLEQAGFEYFLRVEGQAGQAADEDGFVVDLDPVPEAAADLQQPPGFDREPGFLADLAGDGVLVPLALVGVAGGEAPLAAGRPEPVAQEQDAAFVVVDALREVWARAGTGRVEIACAGGLGRHGTALACLAILDGLPASEAVAYVREHYAARAVETRRQRRFVTRLPPP